MKNKQPVVDLPYTTFERMADGLAVLFPVVAFLLAISAYPGLPERIPGHFNAAGEVDGYSSRNMVFLLPVLSAVIAVSIIFLSGYPHLFNFPYRITPENAPFEYRKARVILRMVNVFSNLLLLILTWNIIQAANGKGAPGAIFWIVAAVMIIAPAAILFSWKQKKS